MRRATTLCFALICTASAWAEPGFLDLTYEQALKKAAKEHKHVFIDFYTTWCGPCKMMNDTTFKDPGVVKWLSEKAVALKIDAEAQEEIALKHGIDGYPTLVFLKPDGSEFERLSGYIPADDLKRAFRLVDSGKTALTAAKQKLDASPSDPLLRLDYGMELARRSQWEQAWQQYRQCLDQGTKQDEKFARLAGESLLSAMIELGGPYEKARMELLLLRNQAEGRIREAKASPLDYAIVRDINNVTGDDARSLQFYDEVLKSGHDDSIKSLTRAMMPLLVRAQRYKDIGDHLDITTDAGKILAQAGETAAYMSRTREKAEREPLRLMFNENAALRVTDHYQALLALGRTQAAATLANQALKLSQSPNVYGALAWAGYLSGKPVEQNVAWARKALDAVGGTSADIVDTLARLLHKLGRNEEAVKVCQAALDKSGDLRSRMILQDCLKDITAKDDANAGS